MLEPGVLCILNQRLRLFVVMHGLDAATWAAAIRWICPQLLHAISKRTSQAEAPSDSVVLSVSTQAQLLEQQGLNVAEIASQLGIAVSTVQIDLDIAVASSQATAARS